MAIDVHDRRNAGTYATREADESWRRGVPETRDLEAARRPAGDEVEAWLRAGGLVVVGRPRFCERRRTYANLTELNADLRARTRRSILHELSDEELSRLAEGICERIAGNDCAGEPIHEIDHWTAWEAQKDDDEASA
jgi:hypothetical protein